MHLTSDQITRRLDHIAAAPRDGGRLEMIVARPGVDERTTPERATCTVTAGLDGDNWIDRPSKHTDDGSADPERQLTLMSARYLDLIANGDRSCWPLAGDQLIVDLDLSDDNLAAGDRLAIGTVELEVTAAPHNGCAKFADRFGKDAVRVANSPEGKRAHLRGIYVRVVTDGELAVGDIIQRVTVPVEVA